MPGGSGSWLDFQRMYYIGGHYPREEQDRQKEKERKEEIVNSVWNDSPPPKDKKDDDQKWSIVKQGRLISSDPFFISQKYGIILL